MSVTVVVMNWWWIELTPIGFKLKRATLTRAQGWCGQDFRGVNEAKAEEDLVEVRNNGSTTILEDQDIMPVIVPTQHVRRASISLYLIMK